MQGEDNTKIGDFYNKMILSPFYKLPYYFQPRYDTNTLQKKGIVFSDPPRRGKRKKIKSGEVLNSSIEYRTSEAGKYDQAVLHTFVNEEPGKCHPAGTKIRMFDGSVKNVEDIQIGDQVRGDDNEPRVVLNTGNGYGKIYKIQPVSKANPWYVNEDHILSCKISSSDLFKGLKKGDVINLDINNYLSRTPNNRKHLMCYRVGVEYPHRYHHIDPYFLGIWLGDGSHSDRSVASMDFEIVDWLRSYAIKMNYKFSEVETGERCKVYRVGNGKNGIRNVFQQKHLLGNKHIPKDYMIDSRENRLKLLAGLLDTDGCRDLRKGARSYEITQKRKKLAEQIQELCRSLGFQASFNPKKATMKRKDGTRYECEVYRVNIFGRQLHEIPCLIERKKMPPLGSTWNVKDPSVYGFKIEYDRDDYYYGFNITGNRLYLLEDYTVTHNTLACNIDQRWRTVKPCLRRGKFIRGKAFFGTTCEFMDVVDKGGRAYKKLCYESDYNVRGKDGRTRSGLYAALMPGDCILEGFIDEYGFPQRDAARQWILDERDAVRDNPKDYSELVRKYALNWNEFFFINAERCEFNATILQDRVATLQGTVGSTVRRCNLSWENGVRFSRIVISDDPDNGWAKFGSLIDKELFNNVGQRQENGRTVYFPKNDSIFASGVDPIDHGVVVQTQIKGDEFTSYRRSRPVLFVKRKYDSSIDGQLNQDLLEQRAREKYPYKTGRYVFMMDTRPNDPNVFFERGLMILWVFGVSCNVENQKPGFINWLKNAGCGDFVLNKYVPVANRARPGDLVDGTPASTMVIQEYTSLLATDVEYFGHTYPFIEQPQDLLQFSPLNTTEYDYSVAMGNTELACIMRPKNISAPLINLEDIMPMFDRYGNPVN